MLLYFASFLPIFKDNRIGVSTLPGVLSTSFFSQNFISRKKIKNQNSNKFFFLPVKRIDQESSKRSKTSTNSNKNDEEKLIQSKPASTSRVHHSNELNSSINDLSIHSQEDESIQNQTSKLFFSKIN